MEKTTIIQSDDPPAPAPSDRTLDMAVEFGQLRAEYQATQRELAELKSGQSQTVSILNSLSETLRALQSQANRAEERAETAQATATVALAEAQEVEEEAAGDVLEVTPPVETKIQIEQKPAQQKGFLAKLIFGP